MRPRGPRCAPGLAILAALLVAAGGVGAEPAPDAAGGPVSPRAPVVARLTLDNDHFNFWQSPGWRPDFGYTHGSELAVSLPRAPRAIARLVPAWLLGEPGHGGEAALELRLNQHIYSPWRLPADRPYAGWLGAGMGVSRATARSRREVMFVLGVTGPPSLAGTLQRSLHTRFALGEPPDWSRQLPFEPGFGLEGSAARLLLGTGGGPGAEFALGISARGRLATHAVDLRLSLPLVAGWSPPGLWPRAAAGPRGARLHVRLEPHVDLVARDEFLDGTLFRPFPGPGARPLVAESEAAVGLGWGPGSLEWAVRRRSLEFDRQPRPHTYSSLSLRWEP